MDNNDNRGTLPVLNREFFFLVHFDTESTPMILICLLFLSGISFGKLSAVTKTCRKGRANWLCRW